MGKIMDKKLNIFSLINNVTAGKKEDFEMYESVYDPFMLNRWLSMRQDTLFLSNEIQKFSFLPKNIQYDWYYYMIPKRFRKFNYVKKKKIDDSLLKIIQKVYGVNRNVSIEYEKLLTKEQKQVLEIL